jgi:hypothetical protein
MSEGPLVRLRVTPKDGSERFRLDGQVLAFALAEFWRWSVSDLVSNATRGRLAEFIVAKALGIPTRDKVRDEWGAYDLTTPTGIKVEVKSAAYLQSWHQRCPSKIVFRTPKTLGWDPETGQQEVGARRQADVYVFALLAHQEKCTLDPLNLDQWSFYVLPTSILDERARSQHSITLATLTKLVVQVDYQRLQESVMKACAAQRVRLAAGPLDLGLGVPG